MPYKKRVLAFDFGAGSARAMLGSFDGNVIELIEVNRFSNTPILIEETLCWDIDSILIFVKESILKASKLGGFDAIGIDTWGVDFGLIDKNSMLLGNVVHYRDERTNGVADKVFKILPKQDIYNKTGIQHMRFNTLYQLKYLVDNKPELINKTEKMIMMPDLIAFYLTGKLKTEITNASTTNMINAKTFTWDADICQALGIHENILPQIISAGDIYGNLSEKICKECFCNSVPVIAVATHDTASAVVGVPALSKDFAYISCGTWSLLGTECELPIINNIAMDLNFTNEIGYGKTTRLLKNIMGLWLIQECKRYFSKEDSTITFDVLEKEAMESDAFKCFIDVDSPQFEAPGNIPERICEYCKKTAQYVPKTRGEIMRCIYESLAMKYKYPFEKLKQITKKDYNCIHMIGGGINDTLLCRMTSQACKVLVYSGPAEATIMGNIAVMLISLGVVEDLSQARNIIRNSVEIKEYSPSEIDIWEEAYQNFLKIANL